MKRTVRFRGKRLDTGTWITSGTLVQMSGPGRKEYCYLGKRNVQFDVFTDNVGNIKEMGGTLYAVDPQTVGQSLGTKDATGRYIYEGDIVKCNGTLYSMEYNQNYGKVVGRCGKTWALFDLRSSTIVGNVYDDPGMVGGGKA